MNKFSTGKLEDWYGQVSQRMKTVMNKLSRLEDWYEQVSQRMKTGMNKRARK